MPADRKIYRSDSAPKSQIMKDSFISRMSSLFGFHISNDSRTEFSKKYGIDFVTVDLNNQAYKVQNAMLGSIFENRKLSTTLETLFDSYLNDNSCLYDDIQDRQARIKELFFVYCNDPFISRSVELVADEATQIDVQDRLISIESPNDNFVKKTYQLFSQWGITQQTTHSTCQNIQLYGEAFWVIKVSQSGVVKIKMIHPNQILERLEFSPVHVSTVLTQRDGMSQINKSRLAKFSSLIKSIQSEDVFDFGEDLTDMFDTKLFGFELAGEVNGESLIVPPWNIAHFRFNEDSSEFFPYGRPPLLNCLAPFKQCYSAMMLQGLARAMSFPITMYKVKGTEGFGPDVAFEHVNTVREEYDNIGVSPASAGNEVYTVNTKMWVPADLVDIEVKESKVEIDSVDDINLYQDRIAIASGVPKAYLDQEFGGFGNSGISLTEQYKPFARHVYSIQSTFLQELGNLIRLHYAITGEFDYNTPFTLNMRFPASEMGQEQRDAKNASLELTKAIIDIIKEALGVTDEMEIPESVIMDIFDKYSFLNATDFQRWFRDIQIAKNASKESEEDEEGGDDDEGGFGDFGGGDDEGGGDEGGDDEGGFGDFSDFGESNKKERKRLREEQLKKRYKEAKEDIYFRFLEKTNMREFINPLEKKHILNVPFATSNNQIGTTISMLKEYKNESTMSRMRESAETEYKLDDVDSDEVKFNNTVNKKIKEIVETL